MEKETKFFAVLLGLLIIFSYGVYAAGSSGGGNDRASNDVGQNVGVRDAQRITVNCEERSTIRDRVQCRLENKGRLQVTEASEIPEACRRLALTDTENRITKERCKQFYSEIRPCYNREGREKLACFKRISGLGTAAVSGNADKAALRNYMVALLYELEERIENMNEAGTIDSAKSAEIVTLIIDIKEKIMNDSPRDEIRPMLADLKNKLRELRAAANTGG